MSNTIDLKQLERRAFRSTYLDGLWDIYMGGIVMAFAAVMYRPEGGYSVMNIVGLVLIYAIFFCLFWVGKKFITLPRMGQVRFGPIRKQKKRLMAIILGVIVLIQAVFVGLTVGGLADPDFGARLFGRFVSASQERLAVAAVGALFVGPSMLLIAYFSDFPRGYYIAVLMALAVFLMILINNPIYPLVLGALIILPGVILFINFLKKYPLPRGEDSNG